MFDSVLRAPQVARVPATGRLPLALLVFALAGLRARQVARVLATDQLGRPPMVPAPLALLLVAGESLSLGRAGVPMAVVTPPVVAGFTSPVAGPPVDPTQGGRSGRLAIGPAGGRPSA